MLGPAAAVVAGLQAVEVVKELLGFGAQPLGHAPPLRRAQHGIAQVRFARRAGCPVCGAGGANGAGLG